MDYSKMMAHHNNLNADCTIAVLDVSLEEASRFGIMNADEDGKIYEFEEKPKNPKSNLASMGIYVFTWKKLREYLINDENDPSSKNDFGGNIIPNMLAAGEKMTAYRFAGYWKDVGTIDSLWEANKDMLDGGSGLDMDDNSWKIYSRNPNLPAARIGAGSLLDECMVAEGCDVCGEVRHSVLFQGVTVGDGARVVDSIVMRGAVIGAGAVVKRAVVAEDAQVGAGAKVGEPGAALCVLGSGCKVPEGSTVKPGESVEPDASIEVD
jgi:glucose-1-phosphate adenylyltransferase